jgi:hypothetical protein
MQNQLQNFLTDIALDPVKLAAYMRDPQAAMQEAGLGVEAQAALETGDQVAVLQRLGEENGGQGYNPGYRAYLKLPPESPGPVELFKPLK